MRRVYRPRRDRRRGRPCQPGSRAADNRRAGSVAEPYRAGRRAWEDTVWGLISAGPVEGGSVAALYLLPLAGEFPRAHRAQPEGIDARGCVPPFGAWRSVRAAVPRRQPADGGADADRRPGKAVPVTRDPRIPRGEI